MIKSHNDIKFQYYPSKVWVQEPLGEVTLTQFISSIGRPKPEIRSTFKEIEKAAKKNNQKRKDWLKQNKLFYFTPSITTNGKGRKYEDITFFNPVMVVEFDKIAFAKELKEYLFTKMSSVIAAFISPSGTGCKFLIRIPRPKSVEEYKEYFCGLSCYLDKIKGYDSANYNPVLPLFLCMDEDIMIRPWKETTEWTQKGKKINSFTPYQGEIKVLENVSAKEKQTVKRIIKSIIAKADEEESGHGNVVAASCLAGGYSASGYLSESEALSWLEECIEDTDYLQKNIKGYNKTAHEMFNRGLSSPLYLEE